jgi:hypothetical protein
MATKALPPEYKTADIGEPAGRGHAKWKQEKIATALEQAKDRDAMIPAERVWRELGLER